MAAAALCCMGMAPGKQGASGKVTSLPLGRGWAPADGNADSTHSAHMPIPQATLTQQVAYAPPWAGWCCSCAHSFSRRWAPWAPLASGAALCTCGSFLSQPVLICRVQI